MVVTASPPRRGPTMAEASRTIEPAMPARSKMMPASTNIGMASSGYLETLLYTFSGTEDSPRSASATTAVPASPSVTASGTPAASRPTKSANSMMLSVS